MKEYSTFSKAPTLMEPHHRIVYCHIKDTHWGSLTPLQRCSWCILQPLPIGPGVKWYMNSVMEQSRTSYLELNSMSNPIHRINIYLITNKYINENLVVISLEEL